MVKISRFSVRQGLIEPARRYAVVCAAIPMAIFALLEGLLHIEETFNLELGAFLGTEIWLNGFLGESNELVVGILLIGLSAAFAILVLDRCRSAGRLKQEMQSYVEQNSRVSFQLKALNSHAMVSEADNNGRYRFVNENWQKVFGYTLAEVIGQRDDLLLDEGGLTSDFTELRAKAAKGRVISIEQNLRTKSGKMVVTHTTILPKLDKEGSFLGTVTIRTDISDLRRSQNDRFLTSMLKGLHEEMYVYTVEGRQILFMNDQALKRHGWNLEEAKSNRFSIMNDLPLNQLVWNVDKAKPDRITNSSELFDSSIFNEYVGPLLSGEAKEAVIQARHNGDYIEIVTTLQSHQDGTPIFVSLLRDITDAKLEENRRLENVSTVSHELRSPMTSIKGSLRLLKSGVAGVLDEDTARLVEIADRNSDRMMAVLNDILDFEKIVAEKLDYDLTRVRMAELVHDAVEMNSGYALQHNVEFVEGAKIDQAWVNADSGRLMQVLTNLMSNAAKFSPEGGKVVVAVSDQGNNWRVSVSDKGPGIPPEDYDKVFQSFTQLKPVDGKNRKGTGLGLAISTKIIAAHDGKLEFDSTVGEGTTFFFDLPKLIVGDLPENSDMVLAAE